MARIKKTTATLFLLFLIMLPLSAQKRTPWEKVDIRDDIHLYERWVQISPDIRVKERRGEMFVRAGNESVVRLLSDPSRAAEWMQNVSSSRMIRQDNPDLWYSYTAFSFPWPLEDRDLVCQTIRSSGPDGRIILLMESRPDAWPEQPNVRRFIEYKASWVIQAYADGSTAISFTAFTAEAPEYPRFLLDPLVRNAFLNNLVGLRKVLENEYITIADKVK